ncbi:MAG: hypothetical protein LUD69_03175, partial [Oscillospiraceae bacterium]|nr:hypothetical protein [Oscillospiraceae bacterium]
TYQMPGVAFTLEIEEVKKIKKYGVFPFTPWKNHGILSAHRHSPPVTAAHLGEATGFVLGLKPRFRGVHPPLRSARRLPYVQSGTPRRNGGEVPKF